VPVLRRAPLQAALLALAVTSFSCASGTRVYVNPDADLAFYKKIAVLPFTDVGGQGMAGARVTRSFVTEMIMTNRFQVVEPEEFVGALHRMGVFPAQDGFYDPEKVKNAATEMGVTGILRGAVTEFQMGRSEGGAEYPVIAFDAELVDVNSGNIVWRSSISKHGKSRVPVFGGGSRSLGQLTQQACAELVGELRRKAI
jgi:TolB-like protein